MSSPEDTDILQTLKSTFTNRPSSYIIQKEVLRILNKILQILNKRTPAPNYKSRLPKSTYIFYIQLKQFHQEIDTKLTAQEIDQMKLLLKLIIPFERKHFPQNGEL